MAMNLCVFAVTAYVGCVDRNLAVLPYPQYLPVTAYVGCVDRNTELGFNREGMTVTAYVGCVDRNCVCADKNLYVISHSLRWLCG